jgi:hypothetical protein
MPSARRLSWWLGVLAIAPALALSVARADVERPVVALSYERGAGAETCPDQAELEATVASQLGYAPFDPHAARHVSVRLTRRGSALVAEIVSTNGAASKRRELSSTTRDCAELSRAVALAMSVAIDPLVLTRDPTSPSASASTSSAPLASGAPPASASAPPPPPAPTEPPKAPPPPAPADTSPAWHLGAALYPYVAFGALPGTTFGGAISVRARHQFLRAELAVDGDLPVTTSFLGASARTSYAGAGLSLCVADRLFACAMGTTGRFAGNGEGIAVPRSDATWVAAVGGALGAEFPVGGGVAIGTREELLVNARRASFAVDGQTLWRAPTAQAHLGLVVSAELP